MSTLYVFFRSCICKCNCCFRNIHPLVLDQHYINLKNQVIKAERRVLKELGFAVHVKHPHKVAHILYWILSSKKFLNMDYNAICSVLLNIVYYPPDFQIIVMYLEVLGSTGNKKLVQCAWNFMNDSLRSDVFMRFHPESIACACIYLAARQCQIPLPNSPPWFWLFAVDEEEIQLICMSILRLYARPKVCINPAIWL